MTDGVKNCIINSCRLLLLLYHTVHFAYVLLFVCVCVHHQLCGVGDDLCEAEDFVCDYHLEMLSLSQDQQNPVSIQFDDSGWQGHLSSLKPLGLNIMLNLCNAQVTQQLCRFSDHLSNLALQESHGTVLPVHVPWGLCELSRLIGENMLTCTF